MLDIRDKLYNPLRPVPTVGGQVLLPGGGNATGPRDQREVEVRDDVPAYSTPVLDRPVEVTRPIELCLFISSSARDTGGDIISETADQYKSAINRIFHDAEHPSHVVLPLIER